MDAGYKMVAGYKMNNLMTASFLSYVVDLKKQAEMDAGITPEPDIESQLTTIEQQNLSHFYSQVEPIQSEITSISALLMDLTCLNSESKTAPTCNLLRGIHDQIDSNITSILQKAQNIKSSLASLDASNAANRLKFDENSPVDRTLTVVTNGSRSKLRELMNGFSLLRQSIVMEECNNDEAGYKGVNELKRSLSRLHQVFLDMAIVVERQGEGIDDIEENVVKAREYVSGGTGRLADAERMHRRKKIWWVRFWGCVLVVLVVLVLILVVLIFQFAD